MNENARLQEYENAVEGMEEMFTVLDRDYRYLVANRAFARYRGINRHELIGRRVPDLLSAPAWNIVKPHLDNCFTTGRVVSFEMEFDYPQLGRRHLSVSYFPIHGSAGVSRIACILRDVTERKVAEQALHKLSGQLLRIEDDSRRRLARDLHDSTAQHLAALSMNLSVMSERSADADTRYQRALAESIALADTCLREVRTIAYLLYPPELDELGLHAALVRYIEGFSERSGISVRLEAADRIGRLPQRIETAIFRIVQESLTNIHRHSGSTTAEIDLDRIDGHLRLEVRDAGRGMRQSRSAGVGITTMHERVNELGGWMDVTSTAGGTIVSVTIPYQEHSA